MAASGGSSSSSAVPEDHGASLTRFAAGEAELAEAETPKDDDGDEVARSATAQTRWMAAMEKKKGHDLMPETLLADKQAKPYKGSCRDKLAYRIDHMLSKRWSQGVALCFFGCRAGRHRWYDLCVRLEI